MRGLFRTGPLTAKVNGEVRQHDTTARFLYTPRQMLKSAAARFPDALPGEGDVVLTGTPEGVALQFLPNFKMSRQQRCHC